MPPPKSPFLATSRLNRSQRKYCHCLMQIRTQKKKNPYGICLYQSAYTLKTHPELPRFDKRRTNCIMNYDYSQYPIEYVQDLANEKGLAITNPKTGKPFNKTTLVQRLTAYYIKKRSKSNTQRKTK